jgi:hypothetical protein
MLTVVVTIALAYGAVMVLVLAMLTASRRSDGAARAPVEVLPGADALGRLAAELRDTLRADRVAVIVADFDRGEEWRVAACAGAPGLLGSRLPVAARPTTRTIGPDEASALGLPGDGCWSYAHVPMTGSSGTAGAVMVASRREIPYSQGEMRLIERLARSGVPEFERRRRARVA